MATTDTMQAAVLDSPNLPFRVGPIARPKPGTGQVLIRIKASGVTPLDTKIYAGQAAHARHPLPGILGMNVAGVVEAIGDGVTGFRHGDEIYGMTGGVGGLQGSLAQYAAVDADLLAAKPVNLTVREAASLPLNVITAWEGLIDRAKVRSGQSVLIHGGAGGVGRIAVQIARANGAEVFATGSANDKTYIEQLGAVFIDYKQTPASDYVAQHTAGRGFDVVYDTVGGSVLDASFNTVAQFGHVVSALGWGTHSLAPLSFRAATYSGVFTLLPILTGKGRAHHGEILREATKMVESGKIETRIDPRRFTLDTILDAYQALKDGTAAGRLVIDIPG
ncbi:zinc-dependent alcohol dehydrogenase family protein [Bradyrhizobium canariense]|uniref:NADPH:quinone reductase n=1 Tax=Bradyrhizobium canariense TaxID=255045 RepID=A0A1H1U0Q6_9BRAD|nr:zinc-dependent alcohol dehydrogenase family protein [Bradyrhizobium canariense]SDS66038.1 NADPH:quinone reductase [Bradyrhizobium canariense]